MMNLKDFVPPIIVKMLKRYKRYNSYAEALKICQKDGYQNNDLCEVIAEKTKNYLNELKNKPFILNPTNVFLLAAINQYITVLSTESINILDFGGACGFHYFEIRRFIPEKIKLRWYVVETSQMVLSAKEHKLENSELFFIDSLENINTPIDFLHSSCALQYVPDPYDCLLKLINVNALWVFFNRMMFNEKDREIIILQKSKLSGNGPGPLPKDYKDRTIYYPHTTISFKKFNNIMSEKYNLEWIFEEKTGCFDISAEKIIGRGLLYIKK